MTAHTQLPELQAVLEHQEAIAAKRSAIEQLKEAMAVHQAKNEQLRSEAEKIDGLYVQREDLLADIAVGQGQADDLHAVDERLQKIEKEFSTQGGWPDVEQTVAGLARKLEREELDLEGLEKRGHQLMRIFLRARAELIGAEYLAAAQQLNKLYGSLMSMRLLLLNHGHFPISLTQEFRIPAFLLDSLEPHALRNDPRFLFDASRSTGSDFAPLLAEEVGALRVLGVDIK